LNVRERYDIIMKIQKNGGMKMSSRTRIITALEKRARVNDQLVDYLLEDPHCLDRDPQKDKAYKVALEYFVEKQEESKENSGASYDNRLAIDLGVLIDCYQDGNASSKKEYALKIARYMHQNQENWLKRIPDELKDVAFQIIIEYLQQQRVS